MNSAKDSLPSKSRSMFVKNSSTSALHGEQYLIYDEDSHDVIYLSDLQKIWISLFWCLVIENVLHGYKNYLMHEPDYEGNLLFTQNEYQQARMFLNLVFFVFFEANFFKWRLVQRNCELLCQNVSFYAAHAVSDGGSNHWDIFWKGKSFSLHLKLNRRDWRLILILIAVWFQTATTDKRQELFKYKNTFS